MNIKTRLSKLEEQAGFNDGYCRCGSSYHFTFVIGDGEHPNNICPKCRLSIKPPTAKDFEEGRVRILEPTTNFTREEFEAFQEKYTVSGQITYEQYLEQNRETNEH